MTSETAQFKQGFTLTEVMIALFVGMLAMAGFLTVFITFLSSSEAATVWRDSDNDASIAIERMVRGTTEVTGLRQFHLPDIDLVSNNGNWTITDERTAKGFTYSKTDQTISDLEGNVFIKNVASSSILKAANNKWITLSVSVLSEKGGNQTTREYQTTIQPRNP